MIMNAGASPTGRGFAIRNCDAFFTNAMGLSVEQQGEVVQAAQDEARAVGRELDVYTVGVITCRPTQREADDYYRYSVVENADWASVDRHPGREESPAGSRCRQQEFEEAAACCRPTAWAACRWSAHLTASLRNSPSLAGAGLRGIGVSFVNYVDELPYFCAEVLPRLEGLGLRHRQPS